MRWDLHKQNTSSREEYQEYIYGSADVVGLMCLNVFVEGDMEEFNRLKPTLWLWVVPFKRLIF